MIANLMNGRVGDSSNSSKATLDTYSPKFDPANQHTTLINIDGGLGLSSTRRSTLPVIVLPLLEEFGDVLQTVADSVYKLQQATLGFRVVAITDLPNFKSIRPYGWAISHLMSDSSWENSGQSWMNYVHSEIDKSAKNFGGTFFLNVSNQGISSDSWKKMCLASGMSTPISRPTNPVSVHEPYSWRGWMKDLPSGKTTRVVSLNDAIWQFEVEKFNDSSMVLLTGIKPEYSDITAIAISRKWNVVRLSGNDEALKQQNLELAINAIFDGLSLEFSGVNSLLPNHALTESGCQVNRKFINSPSIQSLISAENLALATWSSLSHHGL
ncbi:hypothetical protein [Glutamicibacter ardleyensis]|uniref:hypothetical protein n=1 Tax=Glutamicibacter ardleyensis TaxID=225894 RepID=UPI003FD583AA